MDKAGRRLRATEIAEALRQSQTAEWVLICEMLQLKVDDCKDNLVDSIGDDTTRLQGQAQLLRGLLKDLKTAPPQMGRKE